MLLYYITDRRQFAGSEQQQKEKLLARIGEAALHGVDFIQLRERDLPGRELERLAVEALTRIREAAPAPTSVSAGNQRQRSASKLLINSRIDVALAVGADGVHLRSTDISASDARAVAMQSLQTLAEGRRDFIISAACHSNAEVRVAEAHGADLVLFGPIFEKVGGSIPPHGIAGLRAACRDDHAASPPVQVLALGSVTLANAHSCVQAGAHGIAGIRLFQEGDLAETLKKIRSVDRTLELEKQPQD